MMAGRALDFSSYVLFLDSIVLGMVLQITNNRKTFSVQNVIHLITVFNKTALTSTKLNVWLYCYVNILAQSSIRSIYI